MSEGAEVGFEAKTSGCDDVIKQAYFSSTRRRTSLTFKRFPCATKISASNLGSGSRSYEVISPK
jgi:hypothetical protein